MKNNKQIKMKKVNNLLWKSEKMVNYIHMVEDMYVKENLLFRFK